VLNPETAYTTECDYHEFMKHVLYAVVLFKTHI